MVFPESEEKIPQMRNEFIFRKENLNELWIICPKPLLVGANNVKYTRLIQGECKLALQEPPREC
jgi:hypothetical protein